MLQSTQARNKKEGKWLNQRPDCLWLNDPADGPSWWCATWETHQSSQMCNWCAFLVPQCGIQYVPPSNNWKENDNLPNWSIHWTLASRLIGSWYKWMMLMNYILQLLLVREQNLKIILLIITQWHFSVCVCVHVMSKVIQVTTTWKLEGKYVLIIMRWPQSEFSFFL